MDKDDFGFLSMYEKYDIVFRSYLLKENPQELKQWVGNVTSSICFS